MLRPRSGPGQWIVDEKYDFEPFVGATEYVDCFGNLCQRLVAPVGDLRLRTQVTVEVADEIAVKTGALPTAVEDLPDYTLQFLLPSRYCPSDTLEPLAREVTTKQAPGYDQVEAIRAWIREHIEYKYGVSNEHTSAADTLRDAAGVCRDFSHIGISLCRALRIPARMVVGYLFRLDPMDLHAWFEAFVDGRWYTFDATQEAARGGRIAIAYGRDAADVALITEFGPLQTKDMRVWVDKL
ncbi:MAG TPA: transglutaminase family protein [Polyangiaceae bacterium]|nr:transglutaminase family protein [Polyangiaceae bacterium]